MFRQKPGILILDLYLYNIKIQTNIKKNSIKLYAEKSQTSKKKFNFFYWAGPGPLILGWARLVRPCEQWSTLHCSHATWRGGRLTCWCSQWCWWRWRGSRRWFMVVMTVAGSVRCSFSSSSSWRDTSLCFFFAFLVCFCLVLLLLVSGGGGAAGGFQTVQWRLPAGGVAVGGDGGSSPLCAEAWASVFFFYVDRYSFLSGGVVAAMERKTNGGSPFSFLLPL